MFAFFRFVPLVFLILQGCASIQSATVVLPPDLSQDFSGRAVEPWQGLNDADVQSRVRQLLPPGVSQPASWAADLHSAYVALGIPSAASTYCASIAVIQQESSFTAEPVVIGLSKLVRKELADRASRFFIPNIVLNKALKRQSPSGLSYDQRIDELRTEKQLNNLFQDMLSELPFGQTWLEDFIPVRTGGPMQVSVAFAQAHVEENDYPYPVESTIRNEVFTQRGGLYFGSAILLDYPVTYTKPVFRFADFNAGRYASRNAAFQSALKILTGKPLVLDGDLLIYRGKRPALSTSQVELALQSVRLELNLTIDEVRNDLLLEKTAEFSDSSLYNLTFRLAELKAGRILPRELLPVIQLKSPKIKRKLSTAWFAKRVETRYQDCMARR